MRGLRVMRRVDGANKHTTGRAAACLWYRRQVALRQTNLLEQASREWRHRALHALAAHYSMRDAMISPVPHLMRLEPASTNALSMRFVLCAGNPDQSIHLVCK